MNPIRCIGVSVLVLSICFLLYHFLIRHHSTFGTRRLALLFILLMATILPFLQLERPDIGFENQFVDPLLFNYIDEFYELVPNTEGCPIFTKSSPGEMAIQLLPLLYSLGALFMGLQLLIQLGLFFFRIYSKETIYRDGCRYVILEQPGQASTFMNCIFISRAIWQSEDQLLIIQHECMHVRYWHSIDRLFTEVLCVFQWFNPFIYWFRKDLIEVHEYQVDDAVVTSGVDSISYQQLIAKYAASAPQFSLGNHFNQSLTLNRIKMIAQHKSNHRLSNYRILLLIPVCLLLFCTFGFQSAPISLMEYPMFLAPESGNYILPLAKNDYQKTVGFGMRENPIYKTKKLHTGIDFVAPQGSPVLAVQDALVIRVKQSDTGYGNNVVLKINDEISVLYAHLDEIQVAPNQKLKQGAIIGTVGSTGVSTKPHLHFEFIQNGEKVDPKDFLPNY